MPVGIFASSLPGLGDRSFDSEENKQCFILPVSEPFWFF
jgi:hypothetical protein